MSNESQRGFVPFRWVIVNFFASILSAGFTVWSIKGIEIDISLLLMVVVVRALLIYAAIFATAWAVLRVLDLVRGSD